MKFFSCFIELLFWDEFYTLSSAYDIIQQHVLEKLFIVSLIKIEDSFFVSMHNSTNTKFD